MRLTDNIYLVGSGESGISVSDPLDCTVYLLDGGSEAALIDAGAGTDPERILDNIRADGLDPQHVDKILLTHAHGDHAGGAAALAKACNATVYAMTPAASFVSKADLNAISLQRAIEAGVYPPGYRFVPCPTMMLQPGQTIRVGEQRLQVISAEGHSAGHCCYSLDTPLGRVLFAGDAIQCGGKIALQAIWDCDLQKYIRTIQKLAELHPEVLLPSHGAFALHQGWRHTERAAEALQRLLLPANCLSG